MSKTIKDRVLELGASITKGLNRLDQPKTSTITFVLTDPANIAVSASPDAQLSWVQPTRADLTQLRIEIDDLKTRLDALEIIASSGEATAHEAYGDAKDCLKANKRIDAAIEALETAIQAHPTGPEVK